MNNILPIGYEGFMIDSSYKLDYEAQVILTTCILNRIECKVIKGYKDYIEGYIPIGNIKFIKSIMGKVITPEYYPAYLNAYLKRKVWCSDSWPLGERVFIKPADEYKRFNGFVTNGGYRGKKRGPYVCSEVVKFINEWRYYICNGENLGGYWYAGMADVVKDAPKLDIVFDKGTCLCLDMGEIEGGEIILVEAQHPFSCGWYGKNTPSEGMKYAKWCAYGWGSMVEVVKDIERVKNGIRY